MANLYYNQPVIILNTIGSSNLSSGALVINGGLSVGENLRVSGIASFGNINVSNNLIVGGSLTSLNVSSVNLIETNITSTNLLSSNISTGSLSASNLVSSNITTSNIRILTSITGESAILTNLTTNNLFSLNGSMTNTTIQNLFNSTINSTNINTSFITIGSILVNSNASLIFNSNTIGNIYTTDGNVGIGKVNPQAKLDVVGNAYFSVGISTASLDAISTSTLYLLSSNSISTNLSASNISTTNLNIVRLDSSGLITTSNLGSLNLTASNLRSLYITAGGLYANSASSLINDNNTIGPIITNSGKVTIGLTSGPPPGTPYTLDVFGFFRATSGATVGSLRVGGDASFLSLTNTFGSLVTTNGNVGIFTTSPGAALDVSGGSRFFSVTSTNGNFTNITSESILCQSTSASVMNSLSVTNFTSQNMYISGGLAFLSNISNTNLTSENIKVANIISEQNISANNLVASHITTTNLNLSDITVSNSFRLVNETSTGNMSVNYGTVSNIFSSNISANNLVASHITTTNLNLSDITVSNSFRLVNETSTGNMSVNYGTVSNIFSSNISATSLIVNNITVGTLYANGKLIAPSLGDLQEISFSALDNAQGNIDNFYFNDGIVRSFSADISISISTSNINSNYFSLYKLHGIQRSVGDWNVGNAELQIGDDLTSLFTLGFSNSNGNCQILYTSGNIAGFLSNMIKFRAITTSIS